MNAAMMEDYDSGPVTGNASFTESKSFATSPIVTLIVGPTRKKYSVHKDLLVKFSTFFAKCLSAGMAEQERNQVELPEDTCQQFDVIVEFMYSMPIKLEILARSVEDEDGANSLIQLYLTADKYGITKFQDCIADYLRERYTGSFVDPAHLELLMERLGAKSHICKLLGDVLRVDLLERPHAYRPSHPDIHGVEIDREEARKREAALKKALSNEAVSVDIVRLLASGNDSLEWPSCGPGGRCHYHVHPNGTGCWLQDRLRRVCFEDFKNDW
ncbi:hypothetical protein H2200_011885 [Cladophialophora chaetospira]|uniref:BTB domain-containing protein n=1 Tax=Cladophialophora chaetospira TaxID=386627 RepID=A0AA38WYX8_9EURO|nr:hypothetical protein H2200_011885 [Cladophialophora chaetospira]